MEIIHLENIGSTNDYLKEIENRKNWLTVRADKQTKGRGRRGKIWYSQKGGAWFSVNINRERYLSEDDYSKLPLITGLAVLKSLESTYKDEYKIKWPNDIYIKDKKICGILVEKSGESYIVGVGVNINLDDFGEFNDIATSLKRISQKEYDILEFVKTTVGRLKELYYAYVKGEWNIILNEINSYNYLCGKKVKIRDGQEDICGICEEIESSGSLIVSVDGDRKKVGVGEVRIV